MSHTFFLDENLDNSTVISILEEAEFQIERYSDHYEKGVPDTVWIPEISKKGWVIISGDQMTMFKYQEIQAIVISKARILYLKQGSGTSHKMLAENFVSTERKVINFLRKFDAPCLATITRPNPSSKKPKKVGNVVSKMDKIKEFQEKLKAQKTV